MSLKLTRISKLTEHIKIFRGGDKNNLIEFGRECSDLAFKPEIKEFLDANDYSLNIVKSADTATIEVRPDLYSEHIHQLGMMFIELANPDQQLAVTDYSCVRPEERHRPTSQGSLIAIN